MNQKIYNIFLRGSSLGFKFVLTLFLGRYFSLSEIGTYGLVTSFVATFIPLVGFRFDYYVCREVINKPINVIFDHVKDQLTFYLICYIILIVCLCFFLPFQKTFCIRFVSLICFLCVFESISTVVCSNLVALQKPLLSNLLFFLRSAAWVPFLILVCLWNRTFNQASTIFIVWNIFIVFGFVILINIFKAHIFNTNNYKKPNWKWIYKGLTVVFPIWISSVFLALGANLDRIITEIYINRELVGVLTFFNSFAIVIPALLNSGVIFLKYPDIILFENQRQFVKLNHLFNEMTKEAFLVSSFLAILIGILVPMLSPILGKTEIVSNQIVLWLLLCGVWLRCISEPVYYLLYAKQKDKEIWFGNGIFFISALILSFIFIKKIGFIGAGLSVLGSSLALFCWRIYCFLRIRNEK